MDKRENGSTFIELIMTLSILAIICGVFFIPYFLSTNKSMQQQQNRTFAQQNARLTMDWLIPKVRGSWSVIGSQTGREICGEMFYSDNANTNSLLSLLACATDRQGNYLKATNILTGTRTFIWNIYRYRLDHKTSTTTLIEDTYQVLSDNDSNPFVGRGTNPIGIWTKLLYPNPFLVSSVKIGSYIRPYNGTNSGLQFNYKTMDGNEISLPEQADHLTIKVTTEVGGTKTTANGQPIPGSKSSPYYQSSYLETNVFLRKKGQNI